MKHDTFYGAWMLVQQVVNGMLLGGIYALVALAFSLTIGILNFLNFSIPALFMLGGVVSCALLAGGHSIATALFGALAVPDVRRLSLSDLRFDGLRTRTATFPL